MIFTHHAALRWHERFNHLSYPLQAETLKPVKKFSKSAWRVLRKHSNSANLKYMVSSGGVLFVVEPKQDLVITVMSANNRLGIHYID